jgi:hypothetical protein
VSDSDPLTSRCVAKAKSTGQRCKRWVRAGGRGVCRTHGQSAKVRVAQEARAVAMEAELAAGNREPAPPRHPGEVLISSVAAADRVMAQLQRDLERGQLTPALAKAYGEWVDRAARTSKLALDAGIAERLVELKERPTRLLIDQLVLVLRSVLADPRVTVERGTESMIILEALRKLEGEGALDDDVPPPTSGLRALPSSADWSGPGDDAA